MTVGLSRTSPFPRVDALREQWLSAPVRSLSGNRGQLPLASRIHRRPARVTFARAGPCRAARTRRSITTKPASIESMPVYTLAQLEDAIRQSWGPDTVDPDDGWAEANPADRKSVA